MANKLAVCSVCGAKLVNGLKYSYAGKQYCFDCYQKLQQKLLAEEDGKQSLYEYIKTLFSLSEIPQEILSNVEKELAKGKKPTGSRLTLHYYYEIQEHPCGDPRQIPYVIRDYYEAAKEYEKSVKALNKINEGVDLTPSRRKVVISASDLEKKNIKKPNYKISEL